HRVPDLGRGGQVSGAVFGARRGRAGGRASALLRGDHARQAPALRLVSDPVLRAWLGAGVRPAVALRRRPSRFAAEVDGARGGGVLRLATDYGLRASEP